MKVIRFLKSVPPYNAGETAGFSDQEADQYLAMKDVAQLSDIEHMPSQRVAGLVDPPGAEAGDAQRLRQATADRLATAERQTAVDRETAAERQTGSDRGKAQDKPQDSKRG